MPEFECFDVGIVRWVGMYRQTGMYAGPLEYNFVMGVASGMPADPDLLPILLKLKPPDAHWQVTAIGRADIWPLHQRCAELGGILRTGLEDTFYLADGAKVTSNGQLIEAIAACAPQAGREIASPRRRGKFLGPGIESSFRGTRKREPGIHNARSGDQFSDCAGASRNDEDVREQTA